MSGQIHWSLMNLQICGRNEGHMNTTSLEVLLHLSWEWQRFLSTAIASFRLKFCLPSVPVTLYYASLNLVSTFCLLLQIV